MDKSFFCESGIQLENDAKNNNIRKDHLLCVFHSYFESSILSMVGSILGQILDLDLSLKNKIFKNIFHFWRKNSNIFKSKLLLELKIELDF